MDFKLWLESNFEIKDPYFRIVSDAMYGSTAIKKLGGEISPGTYWTPRWDAILFMLRSLFLHTMSHKLTRDSSVKIYKINNAIMSPAPKEHEWAFNYAHDAGEAVLVKALQTPEIIYNGPINSNEIENLVDQSFQHTPPVNHGAHGMKAKLIDGKDVFISPNYDKSSVEIAVQNGWQYRIIKTIKSAKEWDNFAKQIQSGDWDSQQGDGLTWFFHDVKWH